MASMNWVKPSQSTLDYFERLSPGAPLETRKMFGLPSRFLNGYMLVGVFGNAIVLHLSETDRKECITAGAEPFKPMGRDMKAYVAIKPGHFEDHDLKWWIVRGMRHIGTLEPHRDPGATPLGAGAGAPDEGTATGEEETEEGRDEGGDACEEGSDAREEGGEEGRDEASPVEEGRAEAGA